MTTSESQKRANKKYYEKNKQKLSEINRQRAKENYNPNTKKDYYENNKEKIKESQRKSREKKRMKEKLQQAIFLLTEEFDEETKDLVIEIIKKYSTEERKNYFVLLGY